MKRKIEKSFSGVLRFGENFDSYFNISDHIVTIIPMTSESRENIINMNRKTESVDMANWVFGYAEDSCSVAFLKKSHISTRITAPVFLGSSRFFTPIIIKSSHPDDKDLSTFDSIEFRGGIVDLLHNPDLAIRNDNNQIIFNDESDYTKSFNVDIADEEFQITFSIDTRDVCLELGKVLDLRNDIHSIVRFDFKEKKPLNDIEKYYSYAMKLFQFCTGQLNVGFEMRLYQEEFYNENRVCNVAPILVKFMDGFEDYANDNLDITKVIRLGAFGDKLPILVKLLNENTTQPYLMFLPQNNKDILRVSYTQVSDICVAFQREFDLRGNKKEKPDASIVNLCQELIQKIDEIECGDDLKNRAKGIVGQLKNPTIKMTIYDFYHLFESGLKQITEPSEHVDLEITREYSSDDFWMKVSQFVNIRNKVAHVGILWNDGIEIYVHLKILIYFSVLKRSGYSMDESVALISWLYGRFF